MVRRVTTTIADSLPKMTRDEAHNVMREIGEAGDPDDPRYVEVKSRVVEAFLNSAYPRVDVEHAERIFHLFRTSPRLLPGAPPS